MTASLMAVVCSLFGRDKPTVSMDVGIGGDATVGVVVDTATGTLRDIFLRCPYCRTFCKDMQAEVCPKCGASFYGGA
jgi:hypothetical protein